MWPESSSVNAVNLVKKSSIIPEISNFSQGITFFGAPCMFTTQQLCNVVGGQAHQFPFRRYNYTVKKANSDLEKYNMHIIAESPLRLQINIFLLIWLSYGRRQVSGHSVQKPFSILLQLGNMPRLVDLLFLFF